MENLFYQLRHCIGFLLFLSYFFVSNAYASLPLPPRFSANALGSDYSVGEADVMLPVKGDNAHNLYLDPTLAYGSDNQGYADLGLGYRWIHNEAAILGGYLFGGYSRIDNNARLWVANPGIEALGSRWDAHLNGYWVMGNRNQSAGNFLSPIFFRGHTGFVTPYREIQNAGSGADVQAGYQLFPGSSLKGYVGSYFFAPSQVGNIFGGAAGLEYWFDHYIKVVGAYTYDNVRHSTGALGIGVEFGGTRVHRSNPSLEERITDPVERYLSELGRGSAIPSRTHSEPQFMTIRNSAGQEITIPVPPIPILTDIAFFKQGGRPNNGGTNLTLANCTYENPCGQTDFSQTGVNTLNVFLQGTTMFFDSATYPAGLITLNPGQSLHSRTDNYTQVATGDNRSVFNGAFTLTGDNTLENIILLSTSATAGGPGISANNATGILITGSEIGSDTNTFATGVALLGNSLVRVHDSAIFGRNFGITTAGGSTLIVREGSTIHATADDAIGINTRDTSGVFIAERSSVIANGSSNIVGILSENGSQVAIEESSVLVVTLGANLARGLVTSGGATIQVDNNSSLSAIANTRSIVLDTGGASSISVDNSTLSAEALIAGNAVIAVGSGVKITNSNCLKNNVEDTCP